MFTSIFTLECILKVMAMSKDFFACGWNIFDLIIVSASLLDLIFELVDGLSVLRGLRLVSMFLNTILSTTQRLGKEQGLISKYKNRTILCKCRFTLLSSSLKLWAVLRGIVWTYTSQPHVSAIVQLVKIYAIFSWNFLHHNNKLWNNLCQ